MFGSNKDIEELREEWPNLSYEEKLDKFLWKMVWFHHEKHIPGSPSQPIWDLAEVIKKANESSEALTKSIRTATWVGGIAASVAVLVSIIGLFR